MKLLFDQNLSYRLVARLDDLFPESAHVRPLGLAAADDWEVWSFAATEGFSIVSKDDDFHQLSLLRGHPPKVVWLRVGNCTTTDVENLLRASVDEVRTFCDGEELSWLELT